MNKYVHLIVYISTVLSLTLLPTNSRTAFSQDQQVEGEQAEVAPQAAANEVPLSRFQQLIRQELLIAQDYLKLDESYLKKFDAELQKREEQLKQLEDSIEFDYRVKSIDPRLDETILSCMEWIGMTEKQIEKYCEEKQSRVDFSHEAGKACTILYFENALCLTTDQIKTLSVQLDNEDLIEIAASPIYFGFFGFDLQEFTEKVFEDQKGDFLEPEQKLLLGTLIKSSESMTAVDLGNEISTGAISVWLQEMEDWFLQLSTLKVQLTAQQYDLGEKAQQKLRIAAKGASNSFIAAKKKLLGNVNTNFSSRYVLALPPSTHLASLPLWNRTVNSLISDEKRNQFQAQQERQAQKLRKVLADQCAISIIGVLPGVNAEQMKSYSEKLVESSATVTGENGLIGYLKAYNTIPKQFYEDLLTEPQLAEFEQFLQMLDMMTRDQAVPPGDREDEDDE